MRISDWSSDVCSSDLFRVAVFLVLGKAAGAVKEMAVAYRYGISDAVDAYQFTMTMANWLPVTIVGVLGVVLIPVLVRLRRTGGHERDLFVRELQGAVLAGGLVLAELTALAWTWVLQWPGSEERRVGKEGDSTCRFWGRR